MLGIGLGIASAAMRRSGAPIDSAATAYSAAMSTPLTQGRLALVSTLVTGLKSAGIWSKLDWLLLLANETAQGSRVNLRNPAKIATAVNSPTFTADRGWTGNGNSAYLDCGEAFGAAGTGYTLNSAHAGAVCNQQNSTAASPMFGGVSDLRLHFSMIATGAAEVFTVNDTAFSDARNSSSKLGHRVAARGAAGTKRAYYNGALSATISFTSTAPPAGNMCVLRRSTFYSPDRIGAFHSGVNLTDSEVSTLYTLLMAYLDAIGAGVSAPGTFADGQWAIATGPGAGQATITLSALPNRGGSPITATQYRVNGGSATSLGLTAAGSATISGLGNGATPNVEIRAVNEIAGPGAWSSVKTVTTYTAPANTVAPTISGGTTQGATLTATAGAWTGTPTPTIAGQWRVNGADVPGATSSTFSTSSLAVGDVVTYRETATNAGGSASATSSGVTLVAAEGMVSARLVGDNMAPVVAYSTAVQFVNVLKNAREWDGSVTKDANGYVTAIASGESRSYLMLDFPAGATSLDGRYLLTWVGEGTLSVVRGGSPTSGVLASGPFAGRNYIEFDLTPSAGVAWLVLTSVNGANHPRDMICVKTDEIADYEAGHVFRPAWLAASSGSAIRRFMDWMRTNGSNQTAWANRPLPSWYTYTSDSGVPVEIMVALCNQTDADMWACIPHLANDQYVLNFVSYIHDNLDPDRTLYLEWSNETWNFMSEFTQTAYCFDQAELRWPGEGGDAWMQFAGMKAAHAMELATSVYADKPEKLVRVAGMHTGWTGLEDGFLHAPLYIAEDPGVNREPIESFDAYAVTGYFSGRLIPDTFADEVQAVLDASIAAAEGKATGLSLTGPAFDAYVAAHQYDDAFVALYDHFMGVTPLFSAPGLSLSMLTGTIWPYFRALADADGKRLVMYEGGLGMIYNFIQDNAALRALLDAFTVSPQMGLIHEYVLEQWAAVGDGPFMQYVEMSKPDPFWGTFGARRWEGDDSPRALALDAARSEMVAAEPPATPLLRAPSVAASAVLANGHSLTDSWYYSGGYPGYFPLIRWALWGESVGMSRKNTMPGSPLWFRWANRVTMNDVNADAVTDIDQFDLLVITEAGPPYRPWVSNEEAGYFAPTLQYLFNFVENAYLNGPGANGCETMLHTINTYWEGMPTWGMNFREATLEYERVFHYMADYVAWRMRDTYPELPDDYRIWVMPCHRFWLRIWDDLQLELVPEHTSLDEFFYWTGRTPEPQDDIHGNPDAGYGLACLAFAVIYQQNPADLTGFYVPAGMSNALRDYFWDIAWDIARSYQRAGMGGSIVGAPGWSVETDRDLLATPVSVGTAASISPSSGSIGTVFTLVPTVWAGTAPITSSFILLAGGVDVTASIVNTSGVLTYTAVSNAALELRCSADNRAQNSKQNSAFAIVGAAIPEDAILLITDSEVTGATFSPSIPAASGGVRTITATTTGTLSAQPLFGVYIIRFTIPASRQPPILAVHSNPTPANWYHDGLALMGNSYGSPTGVRHWAFKPGYDGGVLGTVGAGFHTYEWTASGSVLSTSMDGGSPVASNASAAISGQTRFSFIPDGVTTSVEVGAMLLMDRIPDSGEMAGIRAWAAQIAAILNA